MYINTHPKKGHRRKFNYKLKAIVKDLCPGLPVPTRRLGAGAFGTAYATDDPKWVLKVTSCRGEALNLRTLLDNVPHLVCKVLHVEELEPDTEHERGRWLIWKERCKVVKRYTPDHQYLLMALDEYQEGGFDMGYNNSGYNLKGDMVIFDP